MSVVDKKSIQNLLNLSSGAGQELLGNLVNLFISETPKRWNEIRQGVKKNDFKAVEMAAHSMKSGAAYLGVLDIVNIANEIELHARGNKFSDNIDAQLLEIENYYNLAIEEFNVELLAS